MSMKDTFSFCVENFFQKSKNLRCNIRNGTIIVWSDDMEIYKQIYDISLNKNIEITRVHTVDELRYAIEKIENIKAILLDCPNLQDSPTNYCIVESICFENVDWIRSRNPEIPIVFYSSKKQCVKFLSKKYKFLTPIDKGDISKLLIMLGLET